MPAEPERTVLAAIPDVEDRELRVSLVIWPDHPEFGQQIEIADYVPSLDAYVRGHMYDARHATKIVAGHRKVREVGQEIAAKTAGETA